MMLIQLLFDRKHYHLVLERNNNEVLCAANELQPDCFPEDKKARKCRTCRGNECHKTNMCGKFLDAFVEGVMPMDKTSRFTTKDGQPIHHFMGTSRLAVTAHLANSNVSRCTTFSAFPATPIGYQQVV